MFIDTEGAFRPERVEEMSSSRGWDAGAILRKIVYVRSDSVSEQMETVRQMASRSVTTGCSLVVVDTLTRNFSVELPGTSSLPSRQAALDVHLSEMARDAYRNGRAYLLTNRVTFGEVTDVGVGGKTVEQLVHKSVHLERINGKVQATLVGTAERVAAEIGRAGVE